MSGLPYIDWPWSQVRRYLGGYSCLDRCDSGHTYERWCLLRPTKASKRTQHTSPGADTAAREGGER
ncbi:MAG: hypothetical protein JWM93_3989 [Frankiales bacterium]|nr:hypothetical protein [Frankiales bacterium]